MNRLITSINNYVGYERFIKCTVIDTVVKKGDVRSLNPNENKLLIIFTDANQKIYEEYKYYTFYLYEIRALRKLPKCTVLRDHYDVENLPIIFSDDILCRLYGACSGDILNIDSLGIRVVK